MAILETQLLSPRKHMFRFYDSWRTQLNKLAGGFNPIEKY